MQVGKKTLDTLKARFKRGGRLCPSSSLSPCYLLCQVTISTSRVLLSWQFYLPFRKRGSRKNPSVASPSSFRTFMHLYIPGCKKKKRRCRHPRLIFSGGTETCFCHLVQGRNGELVPSILIFSPTRDKAVGFGVRKQFLFEVRRVFPR